jgi:membrane protein implicated in regulation of membrane protease activity
VLFIGSIVLAVLGVVPMPWAVVLVAGAAVVEVGESWLWIRWSQRRRAAIGAEALIGETATVARACRPVGYVRLHGELWQARCEEGADEGEEVRVSALDGLTLIVERA